MARTRGIGTGGDTSPGVPRSEGSEESLPPRVVTSGDEFAGSLRGAALVRRLGAMAGVALGFVQGLFLAVTVVVVLAEIVIRYIFNSDFTDSDQLLILAFTWLVFLGIPRAVWLDYSPRLGLISSWPERARPFLPGVAYGAMASLLVVEGWSFIVLAPTQAETTLSPLPIASYWASASILVAALCAILLGAARLYSGVRNDARPAAIGLGVGLVIGLIPIMVGLPPQVAAVVELVILLAVDCPIAVALGAAGAGLIVNGNLSQISAVANQLLGPMQNLALLAIPLFMLMGALFAESRLAGDLSRFVRSALGWLPGGIGVACVGTSAIFANISGSAIADTAAIGSVYIPQLIEGGYEPEDAAALQAAAGVIGVVFPPAIAMILFASVASVAIIPVFKAVVVPGLILAGTLAVVSVAVAARHRVPRGGRFSLIGLVRSVPGAIPVLLVPVILDGGIFSGVFTPEESGAVATAVVTVFILARRGMSLRAAGRALSKGLDNMTLVMFILTSVSLLDYGFATSGISSAITDTLGHVGHSPLVMLLVINLIFIVVHEFVDAGPTILVLVPLVLPAALAAGVSPLQLAAVIAINSTIGAVLPPIGVNLYVSSRLAGVNPRAALRRVWPFVAGSVAVLVLVTLVPAVSLWLPG